RLSTGRSPSLLLDITTTASGLLCWRGFHPQERQLASLHLLDHLVSLRKQRRWHLDAQHLGRLQIDDELELGRTHDRQVGRFFALVWGPRSQALIFTHSPLLSLPSYQFLCSTWNPVSSPRPTRVGGRRTQGLSRSAVALAWRHAQSFAGRALTAPS